MSKKTHFFKARISEEELQILDKNCEKLGISRSEYFRLSCCTLEDREISLLKDDILSLKSQLRKVGININQIAKKLNSGMEFSKLGLLKKHYIEPFQESLEKLNNLFKG